MALAVARISCKGTMMGTGLLCVLLAAEMTSAFEYSAYCNMQCMRGMGGNLCKCSAVHFAGKRARERSRDGGLGQPYVVQPGPADTSFSRTLPSSLTATLPGTPRSLLFSHWAQAVRDMEPANRIPEVSRHIHSPPDGAGDFDADGHEQYERGADSPDERPLAEDSALRQVLVRHLASLRLRDHNESDLGNRLESLARKWAESEEVRNDE